MKRTLGLVTLGVIAVSLSACSKKAPQSLPPAPAPVSGMPSQSSSSQGIVPGSQADFAAQMRGRDIIYFDTDKYDIDQTDASALRGQAEWLSRYPNKRARIEGHADERGTREYNLALGEKRANAAKNYLSGLGIDASRLSVVSYGEERPASTGSNEAAWAQNRRAVTFTID